MPAERADSVIAHTLQCVAVPLDTDIALRAAELHPRHGLATADAIVCATAQVRSADRPACDAQFRGLPGAVFYRERG